MQFFFKQSIAVFSLLIVATSSYSQQEPLLQDSSNAMIIDSLISLMKFDAAIPYAVSYLKIAKDTKNDSILHQAHSRLGRLYFYKGYNNMAMDQYLDAYKIALYRKDSLQEYQSIKALSILNYQNEDYQKALEYCKRALVFAEKKLSPEEYHYELSNMSGFYQGLGMLDSASTVLSKVSSFFEKSRDSNALAMIRINQMSVFAKMAKIDSADKHYKALLKFDDSYFEGNQKNSIKENQARLLIEKGEHLAALNLLELMDMDFEGLYNTKNYYELKAEIYDKLGELSLKDIAIEKSVAYQDSIDIQKKEIAAEEIEFRRKAFHIESELEQKEEEVLSLSTQKDMHVLLTVVMVIGLILLALISWSIVKRQYVKIQSNELEVIHKKKTLEKLQHELVTKNQLLTEKTLESLHQKEKVLNMIDRLGNKKASKKARDIYHAEHNWSEFRERFSELHTNFFVNIQNKYPNLTSSETNILALISLRLSSKEIASLFNITLQGVEKARYRIRKKMNLSKGQNLYSSVIKFIE